MPDLKTSDKMLLGDFVTEVSRQMLQALQEVEKQYPEWRSDTISLDISTCIKPATLAGKNVVVIDMDEPSKVPVTTIPIRLTRIS